MSVFKYLSADRLDVLHNATLRATQANALNDPFELRPFIENIITSERLDNAMSKEMQTEQVVEHLYSRVPLEQKKVISREFIKAKLASPEVALKFAEIRNQVRQETLKSLREGAGPFRQMMYDKLGSIVGIVSFSEVADQVLMWTHYSSDHKGFVVEFDDSHSFFDQRRGLDDEFFHLRQVFYVSPMPVYKSVDELDGDRMMCMKRADWSYERERRLLIPVDSKNSSGDSEPIHLIEFPRDAIRSVILGARSSEATRKAVYEILTKEPKYAQVRIRSASIDARTGDVVVSD